MKTYVLKYFDNEHGMKTLKDKLNQNNIFDVDFVKNNINTHNNGNYMWSHPVYNRQLTMNEYERSMTHYNIWNHICSNDEDDNSLYFIIEDDVNISDLNFLNIIKKHEGKFDIFYVSRHKHKQIQEAYIDIKNDIVKPSYTDKIHAYIITKACCKILTTSEYSNNVVPFDEYISYMACDDDHPVKHCNEVLNNQFSKIKEECGKLIAYTFKSNRYIQTKGTNKKASFNSKCIRNHKSDIIHATVSTEMNDCAKRFIDSCNIYGSVPLLLGYGKPWNGGVMEDGPGGGQKINLLKEYLEVENDNDKLMLFTDSYDVILNNNIKDMKKIYDEKYNGKIVFASEESCWPDERLEREYPERREPNRFLNSGCILGRVCDFKKLLDTDIKNNEDDQLYYTRKFLSGRYNVEIDYDQELFLCLNCNKNSYYLNENISCMYTKSHRRPFVIHGNGPNSIKMLFNKNADCLLKFNEEFDYFNPRANAVLSSNKKITFIFEEFHKNQHKDVINWIKTMDYPKNLIDFVYLYKDVVVKDLVQIKFNNIYIYKKDSDECDITKIYDKLDLSKSEYVFYMSSFCLLRSKSMIQALMKENVSIIGPKLRRPNKIFCNFWHEIDNNGEANYNEPVFNTIVNNERTGCFNVPYIWHTILVQTEYFTKENMTKFKDRCDGSVDETFCLNMRKNNVLMYVSNTEDYGEFSNENHELHDITPSEVLSDTCDTSVNIYTYKTPGMLKRWENKYISPEFSIDNKNKEIAPDILSIKMFTPEFCKDVINIANNKGKWSSGGHSAYYDKRINNKESYPTQDVHLNSIGLDDMWQFIVDNYISKIMSNEYNVNTGKINISFVVKYSMDSQKYLRPHHDSSMYTVNICLNDDFEGGGLHFIRRNNFIQHKDMGSVLIHPGRVTHYHEALPINSGTRYVLVSFIN